MRYFLAFLIIIGLFILGIILLFRALFGGGQPETPQPQNELISYARTDTVMRLTIDGPVNYETTHRRVAIEVGSDQNEVRVMEGYQGTVLRSRTYANNPEAYAAFLRSIDLLGYTLGNTDEELEDERGYCPTGQRYVFEIIENGRGKQRFWSTSCGKVQTFGGQTQPVLNLFRAQIPDYNQLTQDISGIY